MTNQYEFLPEDVKKTVPALYSTEEKTAEDTKVPLKFFNPVGPQVWWVTEADWVEGLMFGFVTLGDPEMAELGYISLEELQDLRLPLGMRIERDINWNPNTTLAEVMKMVKG